MAEHGWDLEDNDQPAETPPQQVPRATRSAATRPRDRGNSVVPWAIALVAVLIAAGVGIYFGLFHKSSANTNGSVHASSVSSGSQSSGSAGASFRHYTLSYPKGWETVSPNAVAPGQHAFAALRDTATTGVIVMQLEGKITDLTGSYLTSLKAQLARTVPDYKYVGAHLLALRAGTALDLTYDRTSLHQVRNVVVLPVGSRSIVIATVAASGATQTTKQISDIVSSLSLTP